MSEKTPEDDETTPDEGTTPDLLDPQDFGPEDVMGNRPPTEDPEPEPGDTPGDPELTADPETEPTA